MPHYTGTAANYLAVRAALFAACANHGWSASGELLTKGNLALRFEISDTSTVARGVGISVQGGTGVSSGALVNPSPNRGRFGPPHSVDEPLAFPVEYHIHIFTDPDEVYLVAKFNVDRYCWLAFGRSSIPVGPSANGLWFSALARLGQGPLAGVQGFLQLGPTTGGSNIPNGTSSGSIFWKPTQSPVSTAQYNCESICVGLDGVLWAGNPATSSNAAPGAFNAVLPASTMLNAQPNAWNADSAFNPIRGLFMYTGNKSAIVCDLQNSRYVRIDNYEPDQIVTLGNDRWKIYPFYRKDVIARNGGNYVNHTGTYGWAIRYDGDD